MISTRDGITLRVRKMNNDLVYRVDVEIEIICENRVVGLIEGRLFNFLKAGNHILLEGKDISMEKIFFDAGDVEWKLWLELMKTQKVKDIKKYKSKDKHYYDSFGSSLYQMNVFFIKDFNMDSKYRHKFPITLDLILAVAMEQIKSLVNIVIIHKPSNNELLRKKMEMYLKECMHFDRLHDSDFLYHNTGYPVSKEKK